MGAGGGWELTAQYLGQAAGRHFPTTITWAEVHPEIRRLHERFVLTDAGDGAAQAEDGPVGKLSMGIGGLNACVISRPYRQ